jgi:hypothetical protein
VRRAALMVSLAMTGSGLGMVLLTPVAHAVIARWGWRAGYVVCGVILAAGTLLGGLLMRRDPAALGQLPDGDAAAAASDGPGGIGPSGWPLAAACRTSCWWLLIAAQLGLSVTVMGLLGHLISWGSAELRVPMGTMVAIFSWAFILSAVAGRVAAGFASDWIAARRGGDRKPLLYLCNFGLAAGALACPAVGGIPALVPVCVLLGLCFGSGLAVFPVYLGDLFGLRHLPALFGVIELFVAGCGAVGPLLFGLAYDKLGSYAPAFLAAAALCTLSGLALVFLQPPGAPPAPSPAT